MEDELKKLHEEQNEVYTSIGAPVQYKLGRSIVSSCYRAEIPGTFVLLNELSRLDFRLPIEIFYREDELNNDEISELTRIYPQYITFKKIQNNVKDFKDKWGNVKGWATKVYSILESEYAENLWIDNDNFPIRNCLDLFNDSEYSEKGSMFWRDVYSIDRADQYHTGSMMWKVFNVSYNDGEPFESGQFFINKPAVWKQLIMMKYFTDRSEIYYNFGGDAECWRMAWQYVSIKQGGYHSQFNYHASPQVPYGFMPYGPFHKGVQNQWHKYGGGTVMVQRDREGKELFNHRNLTKFSFTEENPYNADVINEETYHMIIRHIRIKYRVTSNAQTTTI